MSEEARKMIKQFEKACRALRKGVEQASSSLEKDGAVKRFEFTFELFWKTLKRILQAEGIDAATPRRCLDAAFAAGWIRDEKVFFDMLQDRNLMAHCYDEAEAALVFDRIRSRYAGALELMLERLLTRPIKDNTANEPQAIYTVKRTKRRKHRKQLSKK